MFSRSSAVLHRQLCESGLKVDSRLAAACTALVHQDDAVHCRVKVDSVRGRSAAAGATVAIHESARLYSCAYRHKGSLQEDHWESV